MTTEAHCDIHRQFETDCLECSDALEIERALAPPRFRAKSIPQLHRASGHDEAIRHVRYWFPNLRGALAQLLARFERPNQDASNRLDDRFFEERDEAEGCCPRCGTELEVLK